MKVELFIVFGVLKWLIRYLVIIVFSVKGDFGVFLYILDISGWNVFFWVLVIIFFLFVGFGKIFGLVIGEVSLEIFVRGCGCFLLLYLC